MRSIDSVPTLRNGTPGEASLNADRLKDVAGLVDEGIRGGVFPGAVSLIARGGIMGWLRAQGYAQVVPSRRPMDPETIFDLASLTKVVATLPVVISLWEKDALGLDSPVRSVLPEFSGGDRDLVTFRHLLAHTSGLPPWRALYLHARTREGVLKAICETPLAAPPGRTVEYSDLGILLVGFAIERMTGRMIDRLVKEIVVEPLRLTHTMFNPPRDLWTRCAATEPGHGYEHEKVGNDGRAFRWREDVLCGEVHDGNAHYALGGVAPHAGLFSTAHEVAAVAFQWLRPGVLASPRAVEEAITDQRNSAGGYPRGLGWVLHHEGTFFDALGPRAFGHTGFTGTSVAIDPDEDLIVVLLTNRVHLGGSNIKIQEFRPRFHEAVWRALL